MEKSLIVLPQKVDSSKAKNLYKEFLFAWNKTDRKEKTQWAINSTKLFGKVMLRRGKGFIEFIQYLTKNVGIELFELGKSTYEKRIISHLQNRSSKLIESIRNGLKHSRVVVKNILYLLKTKPEETGPVILLGILGFFVGAGVDRSGAKTWYDLDGGVPDLDIAVGGIGNHRSIFFHSIISAAVLETMIFSMVNATKIIHSNLPEKHNSFWDKIVNKTDWATAFATGACTGIAYHLLIDGTLDGKKALTDFPFSMPMEGHNAFFVTNAVIEGVDFSKKGKD